MIIMLKLCRQKFFEGLPKFGSKAIVGVGSESCPDNVRDTT